MRFIFQILQVTANPAPLGAGNTRKACFKTFGTSPCLYNRQSVGIYTGKQYPATFPRRKVALSHHLPLSSSTEALFQDHEPFKPRIKSHLLFAGIIRSSPFSPR